MVGAEAMDAGYTEFIALGPWSPALSPEEKRKASVPAEVNPVSREWLVGAPTEPSVWEARKRAFVVVY